MAQTFVEQRKAKDFVVRKARSKRASAVEPTQRQATKRAKAVASGKPSIERVRNAAGGKRDKWRKA